MPRSGSNTSTDVRHVMRNAAVAAMLSDPTGAEASLFLSDAEVGRLFKAHLIQVIGTATLSNLDLSSTREEDEKRGRITARRASEFPSLSSVSAANIERYSLVLQGRLLPADDFCKAAGITEAKLSEDVASGRVFTVEFESNQYYPIFALSNLFNRRDFARVVRRLGDVTGWSKWKFFTTPSESLGGLTPLRLLGREQVERALAAADEFKALSAMFFSITRTTPVSD
ncbi:Antitoxin Xre/MbcA/ParS-like toxin-binding domain-containing protein (plasmid) [Caballeronia sp. S22]